jgi:Raf kinase inhibitor-like YbhB/YbcL family protein
MAHHPAFDSTSHRHQETHPMHSTLRAGLSLAAGLLLTTAPSAAAQGARRFTLTSSDIAPGRMIPLRHVGSSYGCTGQNVSPALQWSGAPAGTKSFAVTAYDPDAPTGSGFWHWVVFNIPSSTTALAAGAGDPKGAALPAGAMQGNTDISQPGYLGPCPGAGDKPHRYIFTVFALKTEKIEVPANATAALVGFYLHGNLLQKATLTARHGR